MTDLACAPQGAAGVSSATRGSSAQPYVPRAQPYMAGARAVTPIAIAVVLFGASFGVLARDAGMGIVPPILMSLTTFAGSAQFAAASVLESGGALAAAIAAAVLLNLRYLAIGISVSPVLRGPVPRRLLEAQLAIDESWAVAQRDGRVDRGLLLGAGAVLVLAWTGGTVAGVLAGSALGDPADLGLDAMFPALFLALLVGQLDGRRSRIAALIGGVVALALTPIVPPGLPIVAAALGAVVAVTVLVTIALKGAGTLVFADRPLPARIATVMPLLAPSLLAALVVGQTMADGQALAIDARLAGVAAAAVALALRAPLLLVLGAAAGVAAAARAVGMA